MGTDGPKNEAAELEARKNASLGHLLLKAARLVNEEALDRMRARTGIDIRPAHTALFPHIDLAGTRLTTLATKLGISKQAVGQLVSELEAMGALERVPDPADGRAKLVRFEGRARQMRLLDGLDVLGEVESELCEALGEDAILALRKLLGEVLRVLDARSG